MTRTRMHAHFPAFQAVEPLKELLRRIGALRKRPLVGRDTLELLSSNLVVDLPILAKM